MDPEATDVMAAYLAQLGVPLNTLRRMAMTAPDHILDQQVGTEGDGHQAPEVAMGRRIAPPRASSAFATVDLDRPGKQVGFVKIPHSPHDDAWGVTRVSRSR